MKVVFDKYLAKMRLDFENASGRTVYQQNLFGMHDGEKPVDYVLCNLLENAQGGGSGPAWANIVKNDPTCLFAFSAMNGGMVVWPPSASFTNDGYTFENGVATPGAGGGALYTSLDLRGMAVPNGLTILGEWDFTNANTTQMALFCHGSHGSSTRRVLELTYHYRETNTGYFNGQIWDTQEENFGRINTTAGSNLGLAGRHSVGIVLYDVATSPEMAVYLDSYMVAHENDYLGVGQNTQFNGVLSSRSAQANAQNCLYIGRLSPETDLPFTTAICYNRALSPTELRTLFDAINPNPAPMRTSLSGSLMTAPPMNTEDQTDYEEEI